jgi:hypothetical protein
MDSTPVISEGDCREFRNLISTPFSQPQSALTVSFRRSNTHHSFATPATNAGCPIQAVFWLEWDNGSRCATYHSRRHSDRFHLYAAGLDLRGDPVSHASHQPAEVEVEDGGSIRTDLRLYSSEDFSYLDGCPTFPQISCGARWRWRTSCGFPH